MPRKKETPEGKQQYHLAYPREGYAPALGLLYPVPMPGDLRFKADKSDYYRVMSLGV